MIQSVTYEENRKVRDESIINVLIAEEDELFKNKLTGILKGLKEEMKLNSLKVSTIKSGEEFFNQRIEKVNVVLADYYMLMQQTDIDLIEYSKRGCENCRFVILISGKAAYRIDELIKRLRSEQQYTYDAFILKDNYSNFIIREIARQMLESVI